MTITFESLASDRRSYIEAARRNGFEEGLRKLLADLYPDNAHFIYELLQNAEDAGASEVTFDLREDGLQVEHDGPKMFDLQDIDSITGIGQSTKSDDATSIGKFGVGFKAVFAYTSSPVVHSGEHSFAILDLFVPTAVAPAVKPGRTTFWFPFDREGKPREQAVAEVTRALRDVSRSTLLFLNRIKSIASYFPDGDQRLLERRTVDANPSIITIESAHEDDGPSYWYRIQGDVSIDSSQHRVGAAFALDQKAEAPKADGTESEPTIRRKALPEFSIRPTEGQVFIHFPAIKETSGLKFHVHAPFASTVARDSVRDDPGNDALVAGIADLLAAKLPEMRAEGLITDGLLGALPNKRDDLPERYGVIRERILSTFAAEPITPTVNSGTSAESTKLLRSPSALRAVLQPDDANVLRTIGDLIAAPAVGWLPDREGRSREFIESLDAIDFGSDELAGILAQLVLESEDQNWHLADEGTDEDEGVENFPRLQLWESWISGKEDAWLRSFYVGLGRLSQQGRSNPYPFGHPRRYIWSDPFPQSLAEAPILRVRRGTGVAHVRGDWAFMPAVAGLSTDGLVVDALVRFGEGKGKTEKQDLAALEAFYERTGVRAWDAAAQLDARLSNYGDEIDFDAHLGDLRELIQLLDSGSVAEVSYSNRTMLLTTARDGGLTWVKPTALYLDDPFASTGLAALYESDVIKSGDRRRPLTPVYASSDVDVASLARRLGASSAVRIESARASQNAEFSWDWTDRENKNVLSRDSTIRLFDEMVATDDETLLRAIWRVVAEAPDNRGDAFYRANGSAPTHSMQSQLLQKLTSVPWVLDKHGNRNLPEDVPVEDVDPELRATATAPLLVRAGLGRKSAGEQAKRAEADKTAQAFGFDSSEEIARVAELRSKNPDKFDEFLTRLESEVLLPEGGSAAPERRAARATEAAADAPVKRYESRVRSVLIQEPGHKSSARGYLRGLYTNGEGAMVCQICTSEMPFQIAGEYFFEAVQFVKDARRDLKENRLALCPTCAAKYLHARATPPSTLREDLLTQEIGTRSSLTVDVVLAGADQQVRFVGKHAIDLQASLAAVEGTDLDDDDEVDDLAAE
ncbi:hypothetical protein SAMN05216410_2991 [Sanguibacter gelidistatuariae]|uniref:Sacsin/Nov domain-containing protein n=1 Tax=Sanguibacter gelidistatuariae TaxID=1814289 RepID=A0A1G6T0W9_9MICO|nr:hypothetical protein [Sanguibacter gelidistatuariae]SDD22698.1 hypothetical protein SAMN05216410_2991 [Sanguibacter gelidistatuariae]